MPSERTGTSTGFQVVFGLIAGSVVGILLVPSLVLVAASGGGTVGIVFGILALAGLVVWILYLIRGNKAWRYPVFARAFGIALASAHSAPARPASPSLVV